VPFWFTENIKFAKMNEKKKIKALKLPKGFTINPDLDKKNYSEQPLFKDKIDRANHILKTVGLPKFQH
jgi:hypothetical protein